MVCCNILCHVTTVSDVPLEQMLDLAHHLAHANPRYTLASQMNPERCGERNDNAGTQRSAVSLLSPNTPTICHHSLQPQPRRGRRACCISLQLGGAHALF